MGAIEQTLEALAEDMGASCQVVAVCGRNKKLVEKLQARCALPHMTTTAFNNNAVQSSSQSLDV
jgi:hypothetical protein